MAAKKKNTGRKNYMIAVQCLVIAALVMLLFSCLSFNVADWPSKFAYPHNNPAKNWCGSVGAFAAYFLLYYIGPGVFVLLFSGISYFFAKLSDKVVGQSVLRCIGLILLTVAASASFYLFWPFKIYNFPIGSGGVLGVGTVHLLRSQFALLGTVILVSATWIVGIVLLADSFLIMLLTGLSHMLLRMVGIAVPAWSAAKEQSEVLGEIWRKLSQKQKPMEIRGGSGLDFKDDVEIEGHIDGEQDEHVNEQAESGEVSEAEGESKDDGKAEVKAEKKFGGKGLKITSAVVRQPSEAVVPKSYEDYTLPPLDLLDKSEYGFSLVQEKIVKSKAVALEVLLSEFNVNAKVVAADTGPVVTMFELELGAGVKVSRISSLSNDIARALSAGAVRVVAPLPGKHTIGIEVPNSEKEKVHIKDLMQIAGSGPSKMAIPLFLGKDSSGEALVSDLATMPHILIAGTTGSGKSVCINSIIVSILLMKRPDEVQMILVDPKMVEMTAFNTVPHLMSPIVTETNRAVQILEWATVKMDERYSLLAEARVKNIKEFNALGAEEIINRFEPSSPDEEARIPKSLPYVVIIIDELADLMMTAAKEIESYIVRLAQKSRAVGIHLVLATQRPQATVVTGLIKSNMPTRIGFRVAARMDSRIILDQNGAETLLGQGDMLFLKPGTSDLVRAQGTFLDDKEIGRIVKYLKDVAEPQFHAELTQLGRVDTADMPKDKLFDQSVRVVLESKRGSVSLLQRKLAIGYARASRIIEAMAAAGILGEYKGSQAREVMMTLDEYERVRGQMAKDLTAGYADLNDDEAESSEPVFTNEGQKEYLAIDSDDEEYEDDEQDED